jgi:hypothetical protein
MASPLSGVATVGIKGLEDVDAVLQPLNHDVDGQPFSGGALEGLFVGLGHGDHLTFNQTVLVWVQFQSSISNSPSLSSQRDAQDAGYRALELLRERTFNVDYLYKRGESSGSLSGDLPARRFQATRGGAGDPSSGFPPDEFIMMIII